MVKNELSQLIKAEIIDNGPITFHNFMEKALYHPDHGYYTSHTNQFGLMGDFITSPEIGCVFAYCLANCLISLLEEANGVIIELGAGSGKFAANLLQILAQSKNLPTKYIIVERSDALLKQQQQTIEETTPEVIKFIEWYKPNEIPARLSGIVIGNEILDALAVHRFLIQNQECYELGVDADKESNHFYWKALKPNNGLLNAIESNRELFLSLPNNYQSEINPFLTDWLSSVANVINTGYFLFFDYGFARREYYHPTRNTGTLVCHSQHKAHDDPFINIGKQDITAFVDFTAVAEAAIKNDLEVIGYTQQNHFLINNQLDRFFQQSQSLEASKRLAIAQEIKQLTLPGQMGEKFKVIALRKNANNIPSGFKLDQRRLL